MTDIEKVKKIVEQAAIYVPDGQDEGIRIDYWDTEEDIDEDWFPGNFYGTGEETGDSYQISYDEVDLAKDVFYKLTKIEVDSVE